MRKTRETGEYFIIPENDMSRYTQALGDKIITLIALTFYAIS